MNENRDTLAEQLSNAEAQLRGHRSFVNELKAKTAEHGTAAEHFETDLMEAEHNAEFYEAEVARIKRLMGELPAAEAYWVYEDSAGEWRWRLLAGNNRIIADSGEGYQDRQDCLHGIALVKGSQDAPVKEKS